MSDCTSIGKDVTLALGQDFDEEPLKPDIEKCDYKLFNKNYYIKEDYAKGHTLYSKYGHIIAERLEWIKPIKNDNNRMLAKRKMGSVIEIIFTPEYYPHRILSLSNTERIKHINYNTKDKQEPVFLLSIPEYKSYKKK